MTITHSAGVTRQGCWQQSHPAAAQPNRCSTQRVRRLLLATAAPTAMRFLPVCSPASRRGCSPCMGRHDQPCKVKQGVLHAFPATPHGKPPVPEAGCLAGDGCVPAVYPPHSPANPVGRRHFLTPGMEKIPLPLPLPPPLPSARSPVHVCPHTKPLWVCVRCCRHSDLCRGRLCGACGGRPWAMGARPAQAALRPGVRHRQVRTCGRRFLPSFCACACAPAGSARTPQCHCCTQQVARTRCDVGAWSLLSSRTF